jgi:hypothetical protein
VKVEATRDRGLGADEAEACRKGVQKIPAPHIADILRAIDATLVPGDVDGARRLLAALLRETLERGDHRP